ncbi:MAG: MBL fold metallo-hydrolase [Rhabdochlamydiaceae bacterium]|nr:MBL fold metallo-hydrolase [Rhabdochlamydiaceae bacterium]
MNRQFTFLGTGSSIGVPVIGCKCSVCLSQDPKNNRLRAGALLSLQGKKILIDAGPDIRTQALTHKIDRLDAFILTHLHYDHVAGFDDLKIYSYIQENKKLPCMMLQEAWEGFKERHSYLMSSFSEDIPDSPFFSWHILQGTGGKVLFEGMDIEYLTYLQGGTKVLGLRIGNLAYITDIKDYEDEVLQRLQGVEILIVSAIRPQKTSKNFSLQDALDFVEKVSPKKTYLTHMAHEIDYNLIQPTLPSDVYLAYDGLSFSF